MTATDPSLPEILAECWQLLVRGGADRRSPLHTPSVVSIDADGAPDARIMVLRKADPAASTLRFHTDARSPKCDALNGQRIAVLGYHPGQAVQLRLNGRAEVLTEGEEVDSAWARSTPFARRCYLAQHPPGTPLRGPGSGLPEALEGLKPSEEQLIPARAHFALLVMTVDSIDWLHLAQGGHRRVLFMRDGAESGWVAEWVVP
jgi:pyridoxamine 5'-phosphate oxidase